MAGCRKDTTPAELAPPAAAVEPHPVVAPAPASSTIASLPPLRAEWLERLEAGDAEVVVMPPLGITTPARLVVGVHGAGDRSDWACGGWRLGSQVSVFVTCPRGTQMTPTTFGWRSGAEIEAAVGHAIDVARARFGRYIDDEPLIYAGFSQGATLAEPVLRKHAARFPIAILAEGGYQTARSADFAAAYRGGGGRRVVLVCGTESCFRSAAGAKQVLERAGLEARIVGDAKAGHNLNREMQHALQEAWSQIVAPLH
ncbi:MAG TPA: hypothetical protein VEQ59_03690 [Polyangiaceae bacterium]|nr:hypothetical protein [Polyangiaceae bacterium]